MLNTQTQVYNRHYNKNVIKEFHVSSDINSIIPWYIHAMLSFVYIRRCNIRWKGVPHRLFFMPEETYKWCLRGKFFSHQFWMIHAFITRINVYGKRYLPLEDFINSNISMTSNAWLHLKFMSRSWIALFSEAPKATVWLRTA